MASTLNNTMIGNPACTIIKLSYPHTGGINRYGISFVTCNYFDTFANFYDNKLYDYITILICRNDFTNYDRDSVIYV